MATTDPLPPPAATHSLTLDRGLRALRALLEHPDGLSVAELAHELATHRAAVYRLLGPLVDHHLVRRADDGRYILGPGLIELAQGVQQRLLQKAEPVLGELADRLGATAALTVRDGEEGVVASVVTPRRQLVHLSYQTGMRHPLIRGASGHALLAALAPRPGEPDEVARARKRGWAVSTGQLLPGATGVAAAIAVPGHEPEAAISAVWIAGLDPGTVAVQIVSAADAIAAALRA